MFKFSIFPPKRILAIIVLILFSLTAAGEENKKETDKKEDKTENTQTVEISKETFEPLPKGRDYLSILPLVPGVNVESLLGGLSINGASGAENRYYVDGVDVTTMYTGASGLRVNLDFVEAVQVGVSGLSAEYEGSTGGVVHVINRGGGNEFHGSASFYFDGSALTGKPRPTLKLNWPPNLDYRIPGYVGEAEYVTYPEDTWTRIRPGFSLGGPIIKDRLWFFGSLAPSFKRTVRNGDNWPLPNGTIFYYSSVPSAHVSGSNEFTRTDTVYAGSFKLTGRPAANLRVSVNGVLDNYHWKGALPPVDGSGYTTENYAGVEFRYPRFSIGGAVDYTINDRLRMNLETGYYRSNEKELLAPFFYYTMHFGSNADIPGIPPELIVTDFAPLPPSRSSGFQTTKNIHTRFSGAFDLSYDFELAGKHSVKTGVRTTRVGIDVARGYPQDYRKFYWGRDYESQSMGTVPTTLGYVEVRDPFGVFADIHGTRTAVYLQDSWTIGNRLTLNLGLRAEKEDVPVFVEGYDPVMRFGFGDKLAPRVGFSYDISGNGKLTVYGGFGVYYDVMKMALPEKWYGGFKWEAHYYDVVNWDWKDGFPEADHPQTGGYAGGRHLESVDWGEYSQGRSGFHHTQPDIKPFRKEEFTLGVRKTLGDDWTLRADFLHHYIVNAVEDIVFQIPGSYVFVGNPGSGWIQQKIDRQVENGNFPGGVTSVPAVREYTSVTLRLDRAFKDNWFGGLSYTWSRLYGNYSGLVSSDEGGVNWPNLTDYFDSWYSTCDQTGEPMSGLLRTDRTHQLKCYGAYAFDFGLTVGFNAFAVSGVPLQTDLNVMGMRTFYPLGRAGEGRTPWLVQLDLYAAYDLKLSERFTLQLNLNVVNLTNNDTARRRFMTYTADWLYASNETIKNGFDYVELLAAQGRETDPRYNMEYDYLAPIQARLGIKLIF